MLKSKSYISADVLEPRRHFLSCFDIDFKTTTTSTLTDDGNGGSSNSQGNGTSWHSVPFHTANSKSMTLLKMYTKNTPESWNSVTQLDTTGESVTIKMENDSEVTDALNVSEGQGNSSSRSSSPVDGLSSGDGANKLLRVDPKICGVCGDKALGNNFNAITCESCKAFFRRNALKPKEFVCPFSNSCKVDPVTRRFCQKCRLKKCFDIGMKKEWIMTDEEKKIKKIKIEQNRLKRQSSDTLEPPVSKAACMVDPNKYQYQQYQSPQSGVSDGSDSSLVIPQNSPPDPTLPHKIAKQPMMPHSCEETFQQQLSPMQMLTTLQSPSASSSASNHSSNNNNCYSPGPVKSLNSSSMASTSLPCSSGGGEKEKPVSIQMSNQVFIEQLSCESNRDQIQMLSSSNTCTSLWCDSNNSNSSPIPMMSEQRTDSLEHSRNQSHNIDSELKDESRSNLIFKSENIHNNNLTSNNTSQSQCQPLPLLSSLIRPATAESPPEAQFISDYSNDTGSNCSIPSSFQNLSNSNPNNQPNDHHGSAGADLNTMTNLMTETEQLHNQHLQQQQQPSSPSLSLFSAIRNGSNFETENDSTCQNQNSKSITNSLNNYGSDSSDDERQRPLEQEAEEGEESSSNISRALNIIDMLCVGGVNHSGEEGPNNLPGDEAELMPLPLNTMDSILSVAITAEFNCVSVLNGGGGGRGGNGRGMGGSRGSLNSNSRALNRAEQNKLNELLLASQALNAPVDAEGPVKVSDPSLINVINLTDIAIRRLIKMSKKISGFKNMCQEDQVALLKGSCTEMMILRSVVSYDPDRDSWNIPHSNVGYNIKLGVLKEARGNLYEEHQRFVKSFQSEWRSNENIMMLLCAITLFTPERPNVIHSDVVRLEQNSYLYLLKRYLESILNSCEASCTYLKLIKKIAELHVLNSNHLRVFLEVNPREVEPLLIEIFDLK